jgi:hypothetical protein
MTWQKWVVAGYIALSALITIAQVGKHRKPIEPSVAAIATVLDVLLVWLVVTS